MTAARMETAAGGLAPAVRTQHWQALTATHKPGAWEALDAGYSESHRAYHSWEHIDDMLEKLDRFSGLAARPDLIATAIFWHDAVYRTLNDLGGYRPDIDNVRDSGALFRRYTLLPESEADAVEAMIMATGNHLQAGANRAYYDGFGDDLGLFLDLDLSPLAASKEVFDANTEKVKKEFSWVPEAIFYDRRADILLGFNLEGVRLFRREETNNAWGDKARMNILWSVMELRMKAAEITRTPEPPS